MLLASELVPDLDSYLALLIGFGLLAVFAASRSYPVLVGVPIMTGLDDGMLVSCLDDGAHGGADLALGLGVGFVATEG